ncbi:uncharacterized protein LOC112557500 isoform X3 [Pomacea canaliculata]|uniref:uncharacterized protein LOC112557500 isoform X3 n=1 Tax=Pomacea canaliculata TaxID=400727 RepID=UPI000D735BB3|nr:uncharacterized protein LOC112557500 isoform X3 [Pomacea canaliculata]
MTTREDFFIRRLWDLHKSPRDHVDSILASTRDYTVFEKMLRDGTLRADFRFRGYPNQSMQSPRQPITTSIFDDKRRNEENFRRVFGKPSVFDPARPTGGDDLRGSQPLVSSRDLLSMNRSPDSQQMRQLQNEVEEDMMKYKHEQKIRHQQQDEGKTRDHQVSTTQFPWDRFNRGHGAPKPDNDTRRRKFMEEDLTSSHNQLSRPTMKPPKSHDLFIDTLGGPGGTVVRQDGSPSLQSLPDPRYGAYRSKGHAGQAGQERQTGITTEEKKLAESEEKLRQLRRELESLKSPRDQSTTARETASWNETTRGTIGRPSHDLRNDKLKRRSWSPSGPSYSFSNEFPRLEQEKRSLDLDATRGGAGAPVRDYHGKPITRFPTTMIRDDTGEAKIREEIPGKIYSLPDDDNPIYDPFGKPGGGAPIRDRWGNRVTNIFGNFEGKTKLESTQQRQTVRMKEVMLQDLKSLMEEQHRQKEDEERRLRQADTELAELVRQGQVGNPKRDPITGALTNQHLGSSDVSKTKMNYQPVAPSEKKQYYETLTQAAEERERAKQLEKLRERQESNRHFEVFDHQWGAHGGGAPKDPKIRKKANLQNTLHYMERQSRNEGELSTRDQFHYGYREGSPQELNGSMRRKYPEDDIRHEMASIVTPRHVKSLVKSTSNNLYEYPIDGSPRSHNPALPPYATSTQAY